MKNLEPELHKELSEVAQGVKHAQWVYKWNVAQYKESNRKSLTNVRYSVNISAFRHWLLIVARGAKWSHSGMEILLTFIIETEIQITEKKHKMVQSIQLHLITLTVIVLVYDMVTV